jgi:hypothetical protein
VIIGEGSPTKYKATPNGNKVHRNITDPAAMPDLKQTRATITVLNQPSRGSAAATILMAIA